MAFRKSIGGSDDEGPLNPTDRADRREAKESIDREIHHDAPRSSIFRQVINYAMIAFVLFSFGSRAWSPWDSSIVFVNDPNEAGKLIMSGKYQVVDVRSHEEAKGGMVPGARNIPESGILLGNCAETFEKYFPDKTASFLLYCASGSRSIACSRSLIRAGYENVVSYHGSGVDIMKK